MLDLKFVRENPDAVRQNIRNKFQDSKLPLVDEVIALDAERRKITQEADTLRANRNKLSKQIGTLMASGKKEEANEVKAQVSAQAEKLAEKFVFESEGKVDDRHKTVRFCTSWSTEEDDVRELVKSIEAL